MNTLVWRGLDLPLMEVSRVEIAGSELSGAGTQLGVSYGLRYQLEPGRLRLKLVGERKLDIALGECDFFDLGYSPLFNSLPVLRDNLLVDGPAREYVMRWVRVPELEAGELRQRYEAAAEGGVQPDQVVLDPGLGFAKLPQHNWALLANLDRIASLGRPVLVGGSRKRFLGEVTAGPDGRPRPEAAREDATVAVSAIAALSGAWGIRVHEVVGNLDAVKVAAAERAAAAPTGAPTGAPAR